eukprot:6892251-Heterocapsa_arctica.AAC.1
MNLWQLYFNAVHAPTQDTMGSGAEGTVGPGLNVSPQDFATDFPSPQSVHGNNQGVPFMDAQD